MYCCCTLLILYGITLTVREQQHDYSTSSSSTAYCMYRSSITMALQPKACHGSTSTNLCCFRMAAGRPAIVVLGSSESYFLRSDIISFLLRPMVHMMSIKVMMALVHHHGGISSTLNSGSSMPGIGTSAAYSPPASGISCNSASVIFRRVDVMKSVFKAGPPKATHVGLGTGTRTTVSMVPSVGLCLTCDIWGTGHNTATTGCGYIMSSAQLPIQLHSHIRP